ncbi:MAG TPA: PAS domain S-box protein [Steroidobacteraceae bacterium]|nr:PAS domain S-box protein [Steroidobacteraceae bacterium]
MEASTLPSDTAQALQDSETRLQQVLDNTSALVFAKDHAGRYLFVNREFEALSGFSSAQMLGRTDEEIFPPDLAARFRHNDLRVLRERRAIEVEETADFGQGRRVYVASKFPLFDSSGRAYAVCGIATDITERKRLEDAWSSAALAVSQSEEVTLYRQLVRFLATILGADAAFVATYDATLPQQLGMLAFFLDGEIHENFRYAATGTPCETVVGQQFRLYGTNLGERFPQDGDFHKLGFDSYAGHPLFDAQGKPLGLIAAVARRPMEQEGFIESVLRIFAVRVVAELERDASRRALHTSEQNYREIFEASDDAIFVLDWETSAIIDVNPRACEIYGYTRTELLATNAGALSYGEPPYAREDALRWLDRARAEGHARFEWCRRHRDGTLHWDEVRLKAVQIGGQRRLLAITREITGRKAAEEQRSALEARLRQAQKMQAIGQLTGGIAHDFNNLLTTILGYVVLAGERESAESDSRLRVYLDQARRSCERARDLIEQMLMFSRGQRGSPRAVALQGLVDDALANLRAQLGAGIVLRVMPDDTGAHIEVDPVQAGQVVTNLCLNARDAMNGTGELTVRVTSGQQRQGICAGCRASVTGPYVELSIADSGPGIASDVAERIFEPFFTTKEAGRGTGMGLAIVHGIVHEHGGHVILESSPGAGAVFRVLWPAVTAPAMDRPVAHAAPGTAPETRPRLRGRVLIADDEQAVGEFMRELLATWGVEATCVDRGQAALELVQREPTRFDLIITDQTMPGMTGLELLARLRAEGCALPVVLYSGHGDNLVLADRPEARPSALLRKPVDPAHLARALEACLPSQGRRARLA